MQAQNAPQPKESGKDECQEAVTLSSRGAQISAAPAHGAARDRREELVDRLRPFDPENEAVQGERTGQGIRTFTRKNRLAAFVGPQVGSDSFSLPSTA